MEPQQEMVRENLLSPLRKVTPLSKYLALALFVALPFIGGLVGYTFSPEKVVEVEKVIIKEAPKVNSNDVGVQNMPDETADTEIPSAYDSSKYRVVTVIQNPYYSDQSKYDTVVIVAPRGINDYTCGGKYVPSKCYIFLESSYSEIETPKFVGVWNNGLIKPETIKFISPTELTIGVANGDACVAYKAEWKYDLNTGRSTQVSFEDLSTDC